MRSIPPSYELSFSENLTSTATRTTTCRGTKKVAGGVEVSKNEMLKTTANSNNGRKAGETSSCQSVNSQLDECEEETDEEDVVDQKVEHALMYTGRKVDTVKKDSAMHMRLSTRMTEKKSAETMVNKDSGKAVKIDSFMDDEVNVGLDKNNMKSENTNAVVEDPKGMAVLGSMEISHKKSDESCDVAASKF
ncbi:hypothetical protein CTI12_AA288240 [Artemisia annua]|uniref:Uncharacterized protein n=1 Tax=Artemisia annua TaxID=35608 RepID=A0A2U1NAH7_ARTAN|nr:hypothetical protein CTI12_AA288240 [Artemisia annua]